MNSDIGGEIELRNFKPYMFYSKDILEVEYLLDLMDKKNLIHCNISRAQNGGMFLDSPIKIEEAGWYFIEENLQTENSKKVFIAMWFDKNMNSALIEIEKAVRVLGFDVIRIDKKEHNNEISGEILYEIRQCKFLIADVTGQRHGVYFEAGYAMGLGIPVIWCCNEKDLNDVHFDTRQYSHVVWKDEKELAEKLLNRIKGTIL